MPLLRPLMALALAVSLTFALALLAGAGTLICPTADQLKQQDGWWAAPGGWQQRTDYKAPTPAARIREFTAASFDGDFRGPGRLMCFYTVEGQPGVEYTLIQHPSKGGPMDFDWDCPPRDKSITCTCTGLKQTDCEVKN